MKIGMVTFSKAPCCSDAKSCLTLWLYLYTVECQAPLSSTVSQSLLKFMSIELVILCNHLIFDHRLLLLSSTFPSIRKNWRYSFLSFPMSHLFASGSQSIGTSTSVSVLPMNSQGWFLLGSTGLILQSKRCSRLFSSTTVWKHQFFRAQPSSWSKSHIHTSCWKNYSFDYTDFCWQSEDSAF